jgi:NitT/TauT family transport system substrate-binding protein
LLKKITITITLLLLLSACSINYDKQLKISATTWIGYTPLFYAKAKGWLEPLNIKLVTISSLAENMYLYRAGNSDAFVGTQYEYGILNNEIKSLKPIMMFDKSYGGDLIMSNQSIEMLQRTSFPINTYLELDSVNNILLQDFIAKYNIKDKTINYINKDQSTIKLLKNDTNKPTLIVTYLPYNIVLKKNGFKEIASTKDSLDLIVIDAMFTKLEVFHQHKEQFIELKKLVDKSIQVLKENPKEFYEKIKPYMNKLDYHSFRDSTHDIKWINQDLNNNLKDRLNKSNFPTRDLIK